jgi:signal recognition particle subunit SEC65
MTMPNRDPREVVKLVAVEDTQEAFAIKAALESAGIECQVVGDLLDASFGSLKTIPAEIWVHQFDLERAQQILQELRSRPRTEGEPAPEEPANQETPPDMFLADTGEE